MMGGWVVGLVGWLVMGLAGEAWCGDFGRLLGFVCFLVKKVGLGGFLGKSRVW